MNRRRFAESNEIKTNEVVLLGRKLWIDCFNFDVKTGYCLKNIISGTFEGWNRWLNKCNLLNTVNVASFFKRFQEAQSRNTKLVKEAYINYITGGQEAPEEMDALMDYILAH